jgi:hypothetical protein
MLKPPDLKQLRALHALKAHAAWGDFQQMLILQRQAALDLLEQTTDTVALHQLQGRAQAIREILAVVDTVADLLTKSGVTTTF